MSTFLSVHKLYNDCFDNGQFSREKVLENKIIDSEYECDLRISLLENVFNIVLSSRIMNELAYEYLTNGHRTYIDCVEKWNKNHPDKAVKLNSGKNRIIYVSRNINEIFEDIRIDGKDLDILQWICERKYFMGLEDSAEKTQLKNKYIKQINVFRESFGERIDIDRHDILLKIPAYEKTSELSDEEFEDLMETIRPYSKFVINKVQEVLNSMEKEVGYLRFLMGKKSKLNDIDKERKNEILAWLGKEIIKDFDEKDIEEVEEETKEENADTRVMDNIDSTDNKDAKGEIEETKKEASNNISENTETKKKVLDEIIDTMKSVDLTQYILYDYKIGPNDIIKIKEIYDSGYGSIEESINKYFGDLEAELDTDYEDDDNEDEE